MLWKRQTVLQLRMPTGSSRSVAYSFVPDFLANAGGVTCSYFEQVQCNMNYFWEKDEVLQKLDSKMTSAFNAVYELSVSKNMNMRDAAYVIAINRVAQAVKSRGWI